MCGIILGDLWTLRKLTSFRCFRHFAFLQQTFFQYNQWRFLPLACEGSAVWVYSKINRRINGQQRKSTVRVERGLKVPGPAVQPSAGAGLEAGLAERGCGKVF